MVADKKSQPDASEALRLLPQIEQAKQEWEATVDALPQAICLLDKAGKILRANRTVERWGLSTVYDIKGKTIHELLHPDCTLEDCNFATLWQEAYTYLIEKEGLELEINDLVRNRIYNILFQPIKPHVLDKDNVISSFASVTITDITQQKQLEAKLYQYVNQAALLQEIEIELTHSLDIKTVLQVGLHALHTIVHASKGLMVLMDAQGAVRQEYQINYQDETVEKLLLPDSLVRCYFQQQKEKLNSQQNPTAEILEAATQMLLPLVSRDSLIGVVLLEAAAKTRFDDDTLTFAHTIASRIASALDNAALYQLSQEQVKKLKTLNAEITALEELKTDMIRLASHDLRNPMAAIQLSTDIMYRYAKKGFSEIQIRQLEAIKGAVEGMKIITNDILSLERIEAMRKQQLHDVELCALVRDTFDDFKTQATSKSQDYQIAIQQETLTVQADEPLLREVMSNFISNAIKYTGKKGKIEVRLYEKDERAYFEVVDNGVGIPTEQQAKLFQPFYRAQNETTVTIEGTGLGLSLTKNLIERFNGKIHFNSVFGEGSTFGFSLPISANHSVD